MTSHSNRFILENNNEYICQVQYYSQYQNYQHGKIYLFIYLFLLTAPSGPWPPHSRGFQITHNYPLQSVGLLWMSYQLVADTCTWQHTTFTTDIHPFPRWVSNPQPQQASGHRPTPQTARPPGPAQEFTLNLN